LFLHSDKRYITSYCIVRNDTIVKDGKIVYAKTENDIAAFLLDAYDHFAMGYPKYFKMDRLSKLGFLAAEVLLKDSFEKDKYKEEEKGIVLSNANASLDTDIRYIESVKTIASPALFVYTLPNIVIGEISIRNGFKGENGFFIAEKFDAGFLHFYVNDLFANHAIKTCVCGWVDILDENYEAVLYLVENEGKEEDLFTINKLNNLYLSHG
jgi:hypothetical protein